MKYARIGQSRRRVILAGIAAVLSVPRSRANAQGEGALRIAAATADTNAQAFYADAAGFFKRSRLNVEIVPFVSSGAIVAAVVGGSIDIATGSPLTVVAAREQGIPLSIIAPGAVFDENVPTTLLMAAKTSPLKSAHDLEGKTVASTSLRGLTEISVGAWMAKGGADATQIKYVEMPFTTMPPALERGQIDAAVIAEPTLSAAKTTTREFANVYAAIAKEWYISAWFARQDWLAKNRETARNFVQTMMKTQEWANVHHLETARILQNVIKLSDETLSKMVRARFGTKLDPRLLQPLIDSSAKTGVTKGLVSARDMIATP